MTPKLGLSALMLIGGLGFPSLYLSTESCGCSSTDIDADGTCDVEDCAPEDPQSYPDAPEVCDGVDNNCDGSVDENVGTPWYRDADGDGYGDPSSTVIACSAPEGYVENGEDCGDGDGAVNPGAVETCDQVDQDCDGEVDEGLQEDYYEDLDEDGYGDGEVVLTSCSGVEGNLSSVDGDCDDTDAAINPDAKEVCDELDNNCDGNTDEGVQFLIYDDLDGDYFSAGQNGVWSCGPLIVCTDYSLPETCKPIPGISAMTGDCDDANALLNPSQAEACDQVDNNCDGLVDENAGPFWYPDQDGDGEGVNANAVQACQAPSEDYVSTHADCDDLSADTYPGAVEVCDQLDNDCDGITDEDAGSLWYPDHDGDGYHDAASEGIQGCSAAVVGYVTEGGDCNDSNAAQKPGAAEKCDSVDNDCNGIADDGLIVVYYEDQDGDGYGNPMAPVQICEASSTTAKKSNGAKLVNGINIVSNHLDCLDHGGAEGTAHSPGTVENINELEDKNCDEMVELFVDPTTASGWKELNIPSVGDLLRIQTSSFRLPSNVILGVNDRITLQVRRSHMLKDGPSIRAFQNTYDHEIIGPQVEYQFYKITLDATGKVTTRQSFEVTKKEHGFKAEVDYPFTPPDGLDEDSSAVIKAYQIDVDSNGNAYVVAPLNTGKPTIDPDTGKGRVIGYHDHFSTYVIGVDDTYKFEPLYNGLDECLQFVNGQCRTWRVTVRPSTENTTLMTASREWEFSTYNSSDGQTQGFGTESYYFRPDLFYSPAIYGQFWENGDRKLPNGYSIVTNATDRTVVDASGALIWAAKITRLTQTENDPYQQLFTFNNSTGRDIDVELIFPYTGNGDDAIEYAGDPSTSSVDDARYTSSCSQEARDYVIASNLGVGLDCINAGDASTADCMDFVEADINVNYEKDPPVAMYVSDDDYDVDTKTNTFRKADPFDCLKFRVCGTRVYKYHDNDGDLWFSKKYDFRLICDGDPIPEGYSKDAPQMLEGSARFLDKDGREKEVDCDDTILGRDRLGNDVMGKEVHPEAPEYLNDGVDSNCNGQELCPGIDYDGDGYWGEAVVSPDLTCGNALDGREGTGGSGGDCLDNPAKPNSAEVNPGAGFHDSQYVDRDGNLSWNWNCWGGDEPSNPSTSVVTPVYWYTPFGTTWVAQCASGWNSWESPSPPTCGETRTWISNFGCYWVGASSEKILCK